MKTVRKDEKLEKSMVEAKEKEAELGEEKALAQQEESAAIAASIEQETTAVVSSDSVTTIPIVLTTDYTDFTLNVTWTTSNAAAVLELFYPDGESYLEPSDQSTVSAKFNMSSMQAGTYQLRVLNYLQCGSFSTSVEGVPVDGTGETTTTSETSTTINGN